MGNTCLYGATGGRLFVNGRAGERFAVRNSMAQVGLSTLFTVQHRHLLCPHQDAINVDLTFCLCSPLLGTRPFVHCPVVVTQNALSVPTYGLGHIHNLILAHNPIVSAGGGGGHR